MKEFLSELDYENDKVIVFCGKKSITDDIASNLVLQNIDCQSLHGDREQCDREQALDDLRTGRVRILIATDVAARGIDIPDITLVYPYIDLRIWECVCVCTQIIHFSFPIEQAHF